MFIRQNGRNANFESPCTLYYLLFIITHGCTRHTTTYKYACRSHAAVALVCLIRQSICRVVRALQSRRRRPVVGQATPLPALPAGVDDLQTGAFGPGQRRVPRRRSAVWYATLVDMIVFHVLSRVLLALSECEKTMNKKNRRTSTTTFCTRTPHGARTHT